MSTGPLNSPKPTTAQIVGGVHNVVAPAPLDGQALPLQQDADGNLLVNVAVGGGGGGSSNINIANVNGNPPALTNPLPVELSDGTQAFGTVGNPLSVNVITGGGSNASIGTNGAAIPTSSTQVGGSDGTNLQPLQVDASKNLKVIVNTALPAGSNVIGHVITDSGSTTAVTQTTSPWVENIFQWGGTNVLNGGAAGSVAVGGIAASGGAVSGFPVLLAGSNLGTIETLNVDSNGSIITTYQVTGTDAFPNTNIGKPVGNGGQNLLLQTAGFIFNGSTWDRIRSGTATGSVLVNNPTAANLNATVVGTGTFAVQAAGTLTNNNAAPGATNVGVLPALANAANPSWTEGNLVTGSVDLSGRTRITGQVAAAAAFTGNPVVIGGVTGGNVAAVTVNNGALVVAIQQAPTDGQTNQCSSLETFSGTGNPQQVMPFAYNGTTWDRTRSATIGNAVAATGILAASPYVQYNTTLPAPTAGQYTAAQCDTVGSAYVNIEGRKATYSAFASFTAVAGDIAVLPGSASKTIRVIRVEVSFTTSGTAAIEAVQLIKRSAADTSGTSAAMTAVPHDSNFSAASAAPLNYTVAPTPGAAVGTIRGVQFNDASSLVPGANTWIWDFGSRPSSAIVLRGVAQMLSINLPTAVATQTATVSFEWTEE
jgi:hypothetical protein